MDPRYKKPTVVLADDHKGILGRVSRTLADQFEIVATVSDGLAAFDCAVQLRPDVLVLDFAMPNMNGIEIGRELRKRGFQSAIVFLTIQVDPDYMPVVAEIGAGYVSKVRMQTDLIPAIRAELHKRL